MLFSQSTLQWIEDKWWKYLENPCLIQSSTNTKENDFNELLYVTFVHDNTGLFKFEYRIVYLRLSPITELRLLLEWNIRGGSGRRDTAKAWGRIQWVKIVHMVRMDHIVKIFWWIHPVFFGKLLRHNFTEAQAAIPGHSHHSQDHGDHHDHHHDQHHDDDQNNYNQTLKSLGIVITKTTIS